MWISGTLSPSAKAFQTPAPRPEFRDRKSYTVANVSNATLETQYLRRFRFIPRHAALLKLRSDLDELRINGRIIYLNGGEQYPESSLDVLDGTGRYIQQSDGYLSNQISDLIVITPLSEPIYVTYRLSISNISSLNDVQAFLALDNHIYQYYLSNSKLNTQLVNLEFIQQHSFSISDILSIDYRYKIYDSIQPNLNLLNYQIEVDSKTIAGTTHALSEYADINLCLYGEGNYGRLENYFDLFEGFEFIRDRFIITADYLYLIS